ncbi:IMP dehydrogenase [Weissella confusa]|uniref:IMP dehydrogenase n=1 Tax=Weissella confusa TaxID=1583 RepID=UPI0021AF3BD3|nr:IMP dehydrogenase [Weissella confusa]MCT0006577.1 inosine-5-monophosphate dehydrogenase [Weissella confusa]MCT0018444.1 inosine-5-monophosphate dehydrogenase [Weissella confusa]MCT0040874.1 inosine-5-monophosphate dehydrogenase [Weissella confusa]
MMETEVAGLSLDQVLLVPSESNVLPNAVSLATNLSADVQEALPAIGAPAMTDLGMAQAFAENGALAVLPAGGTQLQDVQTMVADDEATLVGVEVLNEVDAFETAVMLHAAGAKLIDVVLDDNLDQAIESLRLLAQQVPPLTIMAGPVADAETARRLFETGIDLVKVAPLPGQPVYTVTTTMAVAEVASEFDAGVVLGAGIRYSGDIVKALAAGAVAVMVDTDIIGDTPADDLFQIAGGLRSGMGYTGSATIDDLRLNAQFVQITAAGLAESHPHDVELTKSAPNYAKQ